MLQLFTRYGAQVLSKTSTCFTIISFSLLIIQDRTCNTLVHDRQYVYFYLDLCL
ncbi:unnamed protein product [Spirodela intermedia]|uniref:Uncharacterized protein n=1 Tax=Spirodela intermedia TaxID=51605 RepID=A0A7I8JQ41_SPIIN|nr:unnamed protein product [Spirodela intermedia]CAA6671871.1 unnamed protein product [Spirodela intermedia]